MADSDLLFIDFYCACAAVVSSEFLTFDVFSDKMISVKHFNVRKKRHRRGPRNWGINLYGGGYTVVYNIRRAGVSTGCTYVRVCTRHFHEYLRE